MEIDGNLLEVLSVDGWVFAKASHIEEKAPIVTRDE